MIKKLDTDFFHADERGVICQILSVPYGQVNYLFTHRGAKRGQHYHKENRETFYIISGKIGITAYLVNKPKEKESHVFEKGDLFQIDPYTMHDFSFMEDTQMIVLYDNGVERGGEKDIYTV